MMALTLLTFYFAVAILIGLILEVWQGCKAKYYFIIHAIQLLCHSPIIGTVGLGLHRYNIFFDFDAYNRRVSRVPSFDAQKQASIPYQGKDAD